jgi:RNA polymerase sigma factor (sigma-70 family)
MADGTTPLGTALRHVRTLAAAPGAADAELLHAWLSRRDDAAFAALVRRHGPMVLNVCRRTLHHRQDAEDAFQATFLALARKAASVRERAALAAWLHGTAYRMALSVKRAAARRRAHEGRSRASRPAGPVAELAWREVQTLLEEEVQRLPQKCRTVFVLCCLEGKGRTEVARLLGLREGTISSRLDQARTRLRQRLARRGVTLSGVLTAAALARPADGEAALFAATARAVSDQAGVASPRVAALVDGALPTMFTGKKLAAALALTLAMIAGGVGALACYGPAAGPDEAPAPRPADRPRPAEGAARTDRHGDPLPAGAIARLGTVRFRHGSTVTGLAFTPDGKALISGSYDKTLRVWDAATGRELRRLPPFRGSLSCLSMPADGRTVAACEYTGEVFLADLAAGRVTPLRPPPGPPDFRACVALSPDGKLLAVGASSLRLWDAAAGKVLRECRGHSGRVRCVAFAPDGKTLASGSDDTTVRLWGAATGKELLRLEVASQLRALAFSPDGKALATGDEGGSLCLWALPSGKPLHHSPGQGLPVTAVAFSPNGKVVASGVNGLVTLWGAATGKELHRLWGAGPEAIAFSPDGATLATGGHACTIRVWDARTGKEHSLPAGGHEGGVRALAVSRDGRLAATGGGGSVRLWALPSGREARQIGAPGTWFGGGLALSPDGRTVVTIQGLWDTATGQLRPGRVVRGTTFEGLDHAVEAMAFAPDGKTVAMGRRDAPPGKAPMVRLWSTDTAREVGRFGTQQVRALAYAPDGKAIATGNEDGSVTLWDVASGRELRRLAGHRREVNAVAFAPDGKVLASSSFDGVLFLWDAATGKQLRRLTWGEGRRAGPVNVLAIAFSPEGRMLASAEEPFSSPDGACITLWEVATGQVRVRLAGHQGDVNCLAFAGDGRTLVTGSTDTTALVWDLAAPPSRKGPDELWADLLAPDGARAWRAICDLAASPAGVKFLGRALPVPPPPDEAQVTRLLKALDAADFQERETATQELAKLGPAVEPALRRALGARPPAEARRRLDRLLAGLSAERPRSERALEALELSRLAEAEQVLEALAKGNPEADRTREAKAALERRRARRP